MADEESVAAEETTVQPERYVEDESFVPDPTDQLGQVLTRGNVNPADSLEYATPMFRQERGGTAEDGGLTQDEYYLTPAQRAAALTPDDVEEGNEAALTTASPAATGAPVIPPAETPEGPQE